MSTPLSGSAGQTRSKNSEERIQGMAKDAIDLGTRLSEQVTEEAGMPELSVEDAIEIYRNADFEGRFKMFTEVLANDRAKGLMFLGDVFNGYKQQYEDTVKTIEGKR